MSLAVLRYSDFYIFNIYKNIYQFYSDIYSSYINIHDKEVEVPCIRFSDIISISNIFIYVISWKL